MMRWFRLPTRSAVFGILMAASAVAAVLPARWTAWARAALTPLHFAQEGLTDVGVVVATPEGRHKLTTEEMIEALTEREELRRQNLALTATLEQLRERVDELSDIREQIQDHARFTIARVISCTASPNEMVLRIDQGQNARVQKGDWVAAGVAPERRGELSGRDLLMRSWLVGRVIEVGLYHSLVRCATDARFEDISVRVARKKPDGGWDILDRPLYLAGRGNGRMALIEADENFYEEGYRLVIAPIGGHYPAMTPLGELVRAQRTESSPLHYDIEALPIGTARDLRWVYVVSLSAAAPD
ncbi:MAG: hypothetical protein KDA32_04760 [Phycisphaerales bacterium]|nr:hypothetical protein [Phycisphaerales bacterium]